MATKFNKNELILDRVRSVTVHDLTTNQLLFRLTSVEEPTLNCTAEGEEVTDAIGSLITTLYRAKNATFSGSNSLFSLDLAAAQYGTKKEFASEDKKYKNPTYEILDVTSAKVSETGEDQPAEGKEAGKIKLSHKPSSAIKYIYTIVGGEIGETYKAGSTLSKTEFLYKEIEQTIITPEGVTSGKIYVEYEYDTATAMKVVNSASNYPEAVSFVAYVYFRDKCNENLKYSGKIIAHKAKLNPESIETALTSTGKHPFEFRMMKEYCAEEGDDELFSIIVSEE